MAAPLLGHNLVRLIYLDEAGRDYRSHFLSVAGVLIHGDAEYPRVEERILALIEKYVAEPELRPEFVFHATHIFSGSGYFDRRKPKWSDDGSRMEVLNALASIIDDLNLPVVFGNYEKEKFASGEYAIEGAENERTDRLHDLAILDCLCRADQWVARYAPSELAVIFHEDLPRNKKVIKFTARMARSEALLKKYGWPENAILDLGLPLKHIVDSVNFVEKADARPLQLADLCAFILARGLNDKTLPVYAAEVVMSHLKWLVSDVRPSVSVALPEQSS